MKKFYTSLNSSTKIQEGTEFYVDTNLTESVENLSLYDDDEAIVYEITLTPIKRVKRGYVELPLKSKAKKRKVKSRS